jgi:hypothetical protein
VRSTIRKSGVPVANQSNFGTDRRVGQGPGDENQPAWHDGFGCP